MTTRDVLDNAFRQVSRNRRRYKTVVWYICAGMAGLIALVTLGDALKKRIGKDLELLGKATIIKAGWDFDRRTRWHHGEFQAQDIEELVSLPAVAAVSGYSEKPDQVFTTKNRKTQGRLVAVDHNFFSTLGMVLSEGRPIAADDVQSRRPVCVAGKRLLEELASEEGQPWEPVVWIDGISFQVIGVPGGVEDAEHERSVFIPITVARLHFAGLGKITGLYVRAMNWDLTEEASDNTLAILRKKHPGYSDSLEVRYHREKIRTIGRIELLVKALLYVGLSVCVVLGGLGISNLMLGAVRDRTAEIGLRKAVGATDREVLLQFLCEATAISSTGVGMGMAWGSGVVLLLNSFLELAPDLEMFLWGVAGATVAGAILGILAGLAPAQKASSLDPAEAMRFE